MPDPAKQISEVGPLSPLVTVAPHAEGILFKIRNEQYVLPVPMARHFATVILSLCLKEPVAPPAPPA
jgi:hypothetical protein